MQLAKHTAPFTMEAGVANPALIPLSDLDEAFVEVTPFETGLMSTPAATLIDGAKCSASATSWRFFIHHRKLNIKLWFDMGISEDFAAYPKSVQRIHEHFKPTPAKRSIVEDTLLAGARTSEIKHVIASHAHWDHIQPLPEEFSNASMICGPGSEAHFFPGCPGDPDAPFDGRIWDSSLRQFPLEELPPTSDSASWTRVGPFPHALDFFKDGSFYLIDAPGHLDGNLAALARVRAKDGSTKLVLLGGDCAHCNVFTYWPSTPFGKIPSSVMKHGTLHKDPDTARATIKKIAELKRTGGENVLVWYSHSDILEGLWDLATKDNSHFN